MSNVKEKKEKKTHHLEYKCNHDDDYNKANQCRKKYSRSIEEKKNKLHDKGAKGGRYVVKSCNA